MAILWNLLTKYFANQTIQGKVFGFSRIILFFLFLTHFMNFFRFRTHFGIIAFSEAFFSWCFYLFVNIYLQIFAPDFGENCEYPTLDIKKYDHFLFVKHSRFIDQFQFILVYLYTDTIFMDINVINKKELLLHSQVICCKWPLNIFVTIIITTLIFSLQVLTRNTQFSYSPKNVSTFYDYLLRKSNLRFCLELQKSSFGPEKPI